MKIVNTDGKKLLVFEDGVDDELKRKFMELMCEDDKLRTAAMEAKDAYDIAERKVQAAVKRMEAWRLEKHEVLWEPIQEEFKRVFGVTDVPVLAFNFETRELTVGAADGDSNKKKAAVEALMGLVQKLGLPAPPEALLRALGEKAAEEGENACEGCDGCGDKDKNDKMLN